MFHVTQECPRGPIGCTPISDTDSLYCWNSNETSPKLQTFNCNVCRIQEFNFKDKFEEKQRQTERQGFLCSLSKIFCVACVCKRNLIVYMFTVHIKQECTVTKFFGKKYKCQWKKISRKTNGNKQLLRLEKLNKQWKEINQGGWVRSKEIPELKDL